MKGWNRKKFPKRGNKRPLLLDVGFVLFVFFDYKVKHGRHVNSEHDRHKPAK